MLDLRKILIKTVFACILLCAFSNVAVVAAGADTNTESLLDGLARDGNIALSLVRPLRDRISSYDVSVSYRYAKDVGVRHRLVKLRLSDGNFLIRTSFKPDQPGVLYLQGVYGRSDTEVTAATYAEHPGELNTWNVQVFTAGTPGVRRVLDDPTINLEFMFNAFRPVWEVVYSRSGHTFGEHSTLRYVAGRRALEVPGWLEEQCDMQDEVQVVLTYSLHDSNRPRKEQGHVVIYAQVDRGFRILGSEMFLGANRRSARLVARAAYTGQICSNGVWVPSRYVFWSEQDDTTLGVQAELKFLDIKVNGQLADEELSWEPPFASRVVRDGGRSYRVGYANPDAPLGRDENDRRLMPEAERSPEEDAL